MLKRLFPICLATSILILSNFGEYKIYRNNSQDIAIKPLPLHPDDKDINTVGELEFLGAWELGGDNQDFGGISGLTIQKDGRFLAISDAGTLIGFGLTGDMQIDRPFIAPMPDGFAKGQNYEDRDSESIEHDPESGKYWVSYEGKHAIRRFGPTFSRREAIARPAAMQQWGINSGAEALLRMPDGRFVIFSEGHDRPDGSYEALLYSGDPTEKGSRSFPFGYTPPADHKITDAKMLPDGRILTLNREFSFPNGFKIALAIFDPAEIKEGGNISPKVIGRLASPMLVDNMEGLAITQEDDKTIIWMISDNNFNIFQRNLLMKLALPKTAKKPARKSSPGFDAI